MQIKAEVLNDKHYQNMQWTSVTDFDSRAI